MNKDRYDAVCYVEPPEFLIKQPPFFNHRYRIVIPCFDGEQAERIAAKVTEFVGCTKERICAVTMPDQEMNLGEVVMERTHLPLNEECSPPAEAP